MEMRKSKVLHKLREGAFVSCFKINLLDPRAAEIAAIAGFDCIWVDQEHIGQDWSILAANVWATKAHGTDLLVRVSRGSYSDYIKPLELDAAGIMVPHVMGLDDAKNIIQATRFFPTGRRPVDGGNNDAAYSVVPFTHYVREANEQRFVILQIEDPEPLDQLDAIAALPGFDMLFFGPGDFSQGIGAPGQWDHPALIDARIRIAKTAIRHGKFAGTVGNAGNLGELREMGYQFVSCGADVIGLSSYCRQVANLFNTLGDHG